MIGEAEYDLPCGHCAPIRGREVPTNDLQSEFFCRMDEPSGRDTVGRPHEADLRRCSFLHLGNASLEVNKMLLLGETVGTSMRPAVYGNLMAFSSHPLADI